MLFTAFVLVGVCMEVPSLLKLIVRIKNDERLEIYNARIDSWKHPGEFLLIVGLAGEILCLAASIHESAKLNEKAENAGKQAALANDRALSNEVLGAKIGTTNAELVSNNLVLRSKVVELEAEFAWRTITDEEKRDFHAFSALIPKGNIWVSYVADNPESFSYATELHDLLKTNAYPVNDVFIPRSIMSTGAPDMGVLLQTRDNTKPPEIAIFLQKQLEKIGIVALGKYRDPHLKDDEIWLIVAQKPRPESKK
jgi:hypothetical protein